jgi:hypothetical protein
VAGVTELVLTDDAVVVESSWLDEEDVQAIESALDRLLRSAASR